MTLFMAFIIGGLICMLGQFIIDMAPIRLTPTHVLIIIVTVGAILSVLGLYQPLVDWGGAGAMVPVSGLGHVLAQGAVEGVRLKGLAGAFGGGIEAASPAIAAALTFGYLAAVIFNPQG